MMQRIVNDKCGFAVEGCCSGVGAAGCQRHVDRIYSNCAFIYECVRAFDCHGTVLRIDLDL